MFNLLRRLKALKKIIVPKVTYVPDLGSNLISIAAATETEMTVSFINNQVSILRDSEIVFTGERAGRTLYHLHVRSDVVTEDVANSAAILDCTPIAHHRLGHVNMRTIRRIFWFCNYLPH
jgi:hypothetical protein